VDERQRIAAYLEHQAAEWERTKLFGFENYNRVRAKVLRVEAQAIRAGRIGER